MSSENRFIKICIIAGLIIAPIAGLVTIFGYPVKDIFKKVEYYFPDATPLGQPIKEELSIIDIIDLPPNINRILKEIENNMVFVKGSIYQSKTLDGNDKKVHVEDYYINKYEVRQMEWEAIMGYNPSRFNDGTNRPIENITREEALTFISALNELTKEDYRLPSGTEWEYAARGGIKTRGYLYAGGDDINAVAWHKNNSDDKTHPVGLKNPNELNLYDMSGNVWEWIDGETWEHPKDCIERRGGSWDVGALSFFEVSKKDDCTNSFGEGNNGFRLCK